MPHKHVMRMYYELKRKGLMGSTTWSDWRCHYY